LRAIFIIRFLVMVKIGIEIAKELILAKIQIKVVLLRLNIKLVIIDEEEI